ncbi:GDP-Man:Man(1)GlcNAc(2)-PP-dolichol alpha-1,3-mannosyltransferase [Aspergillus affinis]|uniref:GDP-Man:Man(1)GlcNAc(2)-PP-dolichol alpha-1,3-mannosyltransferase n=1 Tax=Aspergillus affinis TaxID=1070780 RepID=UPI0022FED55E|nr:uncharacterized protein KD926_003580 [Aspergillus affinis]KAI9043429.1 hypothetical protein KD926_003580 [Aspergillus affinis]
MPDLPPSNVIIIHPDLGIGGAERLIIDVALALQSRGHRVTVYTSHRDTGHCFEEARDGTLDVRVRGNTVFPAHLGGRFHVFMAILRQLHLTKEVLGDLSSGDTGSGARNGDKNEDEDKEKENDRDTIFIVDQVPACVPFLKTLGPRYQHQDQDQKEGTSRQRILFYCHFPDQLLSRRNEGGSLLRLAKLLYRCPFDWFEGWALSASDRVVANSRFTRGVVSDVFGLQSLGDVRVVYPCVDTDAGSGDGDGNGEVGKGDEKLWGGKKILLSINRFERKKDMALAVRAYHGLGEEKRRGTRLVIAGGYDNRVQENVQYHKELDDLATGLGLQTATSKTVISALSIPDSIDVLFLLSVPTAFRDSLLLQSKLLLYTPINEHFGIVPVEAMRAGIPVLASNTGGPLETIVEGETGWLRDAKVDADWTAVMDKVLYGMDQTELDRMSVAAKKRVENEFSLTAMGDSLEEEIGEMLGSERRPNPYHHVTSRSARAVTSRLDTCLTHSITDINPDHQSQTTRPSWWEIGAMPEVIDLLSSTPPHPQDRPPQPSRRPPPAAPSPLPPPPVEHTTLQARQGPPSLPAPTPAINPSSHFILSSDFDTSPIAFTDDIDTNIDAENPSKRRRLSQDENPGDGSPKPTHRSPRQSSPFAPPPSHQRPPPPDPSRNRLFLFSDEDFLSSLPALSSEGPGLEPDLDVDPGPAPRVNRPIRDIPAWNGESDPIVFTSSAPDNGGNRTRGTETRTRTTMETVTIDDDDGDDYGGPGGDDHDNINAPVHRDRRRLEQDDIEPFSDEFAIPDLNELLAMTTTTRTTATSKAGSSRDVSTNNERGPNLSSRTANLLASLETQSKTEKSMPMPMRTGKNGRGDVVEVEEIMDEVAEPRRPGRKKATASTTKLTSGEKDARAREREASKVQREQDRQQEKERKQKLKEEKARDKQLAADIAQVNKLKVDKKESTPEMIVDLASSLEGTSVGNQMAEFMSKLGVELTYFTSAMPNVVRWRRKVKARYNDAAGHWEPCAFHIRQEEQVLVLLTAQEFVDLVIASPATQYTSVSPDLPAETAAAAVVITLEQHVQQLKNAYPGCKPIYLIEGLTGWMRKNQNSRNRAYVAEVRRQMEQETTSSQQPSSRGRKKAARKPETTPPVDDDTVEDALLQLQVTHSCLIHHAAAAAESAEWIKNFTEHVSTVPYRHEMMEGRDAAFCMDTGQVKPGDTKSDTFVKMLQEVHRVTAPMAYGIEVRYPSVLDLVQGMRRGGPGLLEDVKKSANKNGALTDSRIGPAASKRLYKVFMGLDSSSTDI